MSYNGEHDKELMERVRVGFEERARISSRIENRPKTPRKINKNKRTVSIAKNVVVIPDEKKGGSSKKQAVVKQKGRKKSSNKPVTTGLYICYVCEKTYKTKRGVLKHMTNCGK